MQPVKPWGSPSLEFCLNRTSVDGAIAKVTKTNEIHLTCLNFTPDMMETWLQANETEVWLGIAIG